MVVENFIAATGSSQLLQSSKSAPSKSAGIFIYELQPDSKLKLALKNSSTPVNALTTTSTHIFAAQAEKAVVHVYSREKQNQEASIFFPYHVHSLAIVGDGILVLGTAEGRLVTWELSTGRQVSTVAAHLQPVNCVATTNSHIISGSEDSKLYVWLISHVLSLSQRDSREPLRCLSNHQAPITSLTVGHSRSTTNICVSASKDNTILVWNYHSGQLLRTFLLSRAPLCLTLDPCDRGVYVGLDNGSIQMIEFFQPNSNMHPLHVTELQAIPVKVSTPEWSVPGDVGSILCVKSNYDGTLLLTGHSSGQINQWDVGRRQYSSEISNLTTPVTNIYIESPFPSTQKTKIITVTKPKLTDHNYTLNTQLIGSVSSEFDEAVLAEGIPIDMIKEAVAKYTTPSEFSSEANQKLRKENDDLWKIIHEQRAVQKMMLEKYTPLQPT
ncbi:WD repeat-containing protein 18 [Erysiphe necator]|uniref:Pre-rRNA-processing protein IPI3 n=1 Tax=Uncinula necator TaxID=52586 RepID=A0A0B1PA76_UNCNE|nr:WD repeat-containing protein 18 [Erysiphe necator]KHJ33826.1 putative wd repeat protein [Erysiphe necator]